ncbi:neuromedin-K receptor-like [Ptychodera flava]|uniref:neuromedin-K receptor-like n=1 Tax=Ptychodera flava TaxID=63121 RepID=UPI00396A308D
MANNITNDSTQDWDAIEATIRAFIRKMKMEENSEKQPLSKVYESFTTLNPDYEDDEKMALPFEWITALTCAFGVNIALSIVGNIGVIVVLLFGRSKTVLNRLLMNLALADLTMAIFCMPFTFPTIMYGRWIFSANMCPTVLFLQHVSVFVSVYTLTAIGVDRYFAVMHPLKIRITKTKGKVLIALIWLVSVSLSIVQAVFARAKPFDYGRTVYLCTDWWPSATAASVYEICIFLVSYIVPFIALLYTYVKIGIKLWGRQIPGNADRIRDESCTKSKKRIIKMLIIVVLLFGLCWLPLQVFNMVVKFFPYLFGDEERQDMIRKVNACVLWLAMSNSFMNPIIYSFYNDGFRADAKQLCVRFRNLHVLHAYSFLPRPRTLTTSTTCTSMRSVPILNSRSSSRSRDTVAPVQVK